MQPITLRENLDQMECVRSISNYNRSTHFHSCTELANDMAGRRGKDFVFKVPCGTIVKQVERVCNSLYMKHSSNLCGDCIIV